MVPIDCFDTENGLQEQAALRDIAKRYFHSVFSTSVSNKRSRGAGSLALFEGLEDESGAVTQADLSSQIPQPLQSTIEPPPYSSTSTSSSSPTSSSMKLQERIVAPGSQGFRGSIPQPAGFCLLEGDDKPHASCSVSREPSAFPDRL